MHVHYCYLSKLNNIRKIQWKVFLIVCFDRYIFHSPLPSSPLTYYPLSCLVHSEFTQKNLSFLLPNFDSLWFVVLDSVNFFLVVAFTSLAPTVLLWPFIRVSWALPNVWIWVSVSAPISCWMMPLLWLLNWTLVYEYRRISLAMISLTFYMLIMIGSLLRFLSIQSLVSGPLGSISHELPPCGFGLVLNQLLINHPHKFCSTLMPTHLTGRRNC